MNPIKNTCKLVTVIAILLSSIIDITGQSLPLSYYLPEIEYDAAIPTPQSFLGYQIGDWHVSHDQVVAYFKALDAASDRIELYEYARSHENRPLYVAIISTPENLKNKEKIKAFHADLSDVSKASSISIKDMPAVLYQGYSIHGNESSGVNASLLVAYYLAAGKSNEVLSLLKNTVILLDPCFNPDGVQRFSTWANSHKGQTLITDPKSREFNEVWPGGRFNHYWFDLNRDWLLLVHPETRGRVKLLHEWHPNVLTDHHEMGTNSTFFFQPGIPSSTNPNTPWENQTLTEEIGKYHAKALDSIGSLYFTKSNFDDFYYGKGSTYPDAMGGIGILFEQASSRGHLQESVNGLISLAFTVRNQVTTSLSTQKAVLGLKDKLLAYKKGFYKDLSEKMSKETIKSYVFTDNDEVKLHNFLNILDQHHVEVYALDKNMTINNKSFKKENSYFVPIDQAQPILAKTIFEQVKTFVDSSFYDVSAWTMSHAYDLTYESTTVLPTGKKININQLTPAGKLIMEGNHPYAFVITPNQLHAHAGLYAIQQKGLNTKVMQQEMKTSVGVKNMTFPMGSIVIPMQNQASSTNNITSLITEIAIQNQLTVYGLSSGNGVNEVTVGHPSVAALTMPKVLMMVGKGLRAQSVGEIWHHADQRLHIPFTMLEVDNLDNTDLDRYNTLLMPSGSYAAWGESELKKLKEWAGMGNTIITFGLATDWAVSKGLITLTSKRPTNAKHQDDGSYANADRELDAQYIGGSIFEAIVDLTHPLFYGYEDNKVSFMHSGTKFYEPTNNKYATPASYSDDYLVSGYLPKALKNDIKGAAAISVHKLGRGKVICFQDLPLFRGYWYGGMKVFNNALFYNSIIDRRTAE